MRIIFDIDADWHATIKCVETDLVWSRKLRKHLVGAHGYFPLPPEEVATAAAGDAGAQGKTPYELWADDPNGLWQVYDNITRRTPHAGDSARPSDIQMFGTYLFDVLIGVELWDKILLAAKNDDLIELALSWHKHAERHESYLNRLPWEMMRRPARFLIEGVPKAEADVPKTVAVTRRVAGTERLSGLEIGPPPRVLFVVGTSLTEQQIRPGAEFMGLLRQFKSNQSSFLTKILQRATPQQINDEVKSFRPDVVHFICHGGTHPETGVGYLNLELGKNEKEAIGEAGAAQRQRTAAQLLTFLTGDEGRLPAIVVLSACYSAGPRVGKTLAGHEAAPLAEELVRGGVPVVIGMSGQIADDACRMFTRQFGASLLTGKQLVKATGDGRRAAFAEGPPPLNSVDWALPAVFLAEGVASDYKPVKPDADDAKTVFKWLREYGVDVVPVFCSREDFFDAYYDLFKPYEPSVLVAYAEKDIKDWGKTRLLQQLAATALREGHIPCIVSGPGDDWKPPHTVGQLCAELLKTVGKARDALGLPAPLNSILLQILLDMAADSGQYAEASARAQKIREKPGAQPKVDFDRLVSTLISMNLDDFVKADDVREALRLELLALIEEARAQHPNIVKQESRVLVLLDEAHKYDKAFNPLFHELLGDSGLGNAKEPVPVVMSLAKGTPADENLKAAEEKLRSRIRFLKLPTFSDDEYMMVYQQVLMHPFTDSYPVISEKAWVFDYNVDEKTRSKHIKRLYERLQRIPSDFKSDRFFLTIEDAKDDGFVVLADDEARLAALKDK
jgi:hypothetical protein